LCRLGRGEWVFPGKKDEKGKNVNKKGNKSRQKLDMAEKNWQMNSKKRLTHTGAIFPVSFYLFFFSSTFFFFLEKSAERLAGSFMLLSFKNGFRVQGKYFFSSYEGAFF
jgi:hypothetical protein